MLVFPELCLSAYYPADLLDEPEFLAQIEQGLRQLLECTRATPGLHWVIGAPLRREGPRDEIATFVTKLVEFSLAATLASRRDDGLNY